MQKLIYILEDDISIGFILKHILVEEGYQIEVFETVSSFRIALNSVLPDLLLMDVRLPDGNGMELCAELKAAGDFHVPVLMMSADWPWRNKEICLANEYIAKPFDIDHVISKISGYLRQTG